jgi:anti-anti-sigma factor
MIACRENTVRADLEGVLDFRSVPEVRKGPLKMAKRRTTQVLELDFSRVTSLDTAGIAVLVELMRCLHHKCGQLKLVELNGNVRRMIRLARLEAMFPMMLPVDNGA